MFCYHSHEMLDTYTSPINGYQKIEPTRNLGIDYVYGTRRYTLGRILIKFPSVLHTFDKIRKTTMPILQYSNGIIVLHL